MSIDVHIARRFKLLAEELLSPSPVLSPADLGVASDLNAAPLTPATVNKAVKKRTRRAGFSKRGLERAIRAAQAAGISARFEVVGDKIVVVPIGQSEDEVDANGVANGLDPWEQAMSCLPATRRKQ